MHTVLKTYTYTHPYTHTMTDTHTHTSNKHLWSTILYRKYNITSVGSLSRFSSSCFPEGIPVTSQTFVIIHHYHLNVSCQGLMCLNSWFTAVGLFGGGDLEGRIGS